MDLTLELCLKYGSKCGNITLGSEVSYLNLFEKISFQDVFGERFSPRGHSDIFLNLQVKVYGGKKLKIFPVKYLEVEDVWNILSCYRDDEIISYVDSTELSETMRDFSDDCVELARQVFVSCELVRDHHAENNFDWLVRRAEAAYRKIAFEIERANYKR